MILFPCLWPWRDPLRLPMQSGDWCFPHVQSIQEGMLKWGSWDFPGGLVVRALCFPCRGTDIVSGQGTKIPPAAQNSQHFFFEWGPTCGLGNIWVLEFPLHQTPQIPPLYTTSGPGIWNKRKVSGPACARPPDLMGPLHLASLIWNSGHAGVGRSQDPSAPKGVRSWRSL